MQFDYFALLLTGDVSIPLSLLLVFGGAKLLAECFERLRLPGIVAEILAGVLLGPSVLGWISPNELLSTLSDIGVMFLLFRVGLDVKASELLEAGGTATIVAVAGVIVPFLMGWGILRAWGAGHTEAIFVGAAMVATSVGITAQVLASKGLLHLASSKIILAAAVIDDVLGLLVLAVVSSMARGRVQLVEISLTVVFAVVFVVIVAKWGTAAANRIVPRMQASMRVAESEFVIAMVLLFSLSLLAVYAGVAAIVGAFLAGMSLGESVETRVKDLVHGTSELLVPFFLVGIGLHADLSAFSNRSMLLLAAVLIVAAVVSKFVGCGLGAWRLGRQEMIRIGVGMAPRGEVGMVVAQLGLAMGVITKPVYGVVVLMAAATTIVAPPLLTLAYRGVERGQPEDVYTVD